MHSSPLRQINSNAAHAHITNEMSERPWHESVTRVRHEKIKLMLVCQDLGLTLQRVLTETDGSMLVQTMPISCIADAARFVASDVYQSQLAVAYGDITNQVNGFFAMHERE